MENSKIQWTDATFNPWLGCQRVHAGCIHCYAETLMDKRYGKVKWGPGGTRVKTSASYWKGPLSWNRKAAAAGTRTKVFCCSLADVFEDRPELVPWRAELFDLIDRTPNLDWLLLTKRPELIRSMWPTEGPQLRENVWLGTSPCDQKTADEAVPAILECRDLAPVLFLSAEPLIGPVDLRPWLPSWVAWATRPAVIDWVIVGGESGHGARPCHKEWVRDLVQQCRDARVPCFVKQLGANHPDAAGFCLDDSHKGDDIKRWPVELQVREFPAPEAVA